MKISSLPAILLLAADAPVWAQCAMCRTAAAAQGSQAANSINTAILILLIPAVALFSGVFLLAFRCSSPAGPDEFKPRKGEQE